MIGIEMLTDAHRFYIDQLAALAVSRLHSRQPLPDPLTESRHLPIEVGLVGPEHLLFGVAEMLQLLDGYLDVFVGYDASASCAFASTRCSPQQRQLAGHSVCCHCLALAFITCSCEP